MKHEHKFAGVSEIETEGRTITGYASVFNSVDRGGDEVQPGAFDETIKENKTGLPMLYMHNMDNLIGRFTKLEADTKGLRVEGVLTPGHAVAENVLASLKAGHLEGLSIGYYAKVYTTREDKKAGYVRELRDVRLIEISLVAYPMEPKAKVTALKAAALQPREFRQKLQDAMRDAGYDLSRKEAEALCAHGLKGLINERDAVDNSIELGTFSRAVIDAIRVAKIEGNSK